MTRSSTSPVRGSTCGGSRVCVFSATSCVLPQIGLVSTHVAAGPGRRAHLPFGLSFYPLCAFRHLAQRAFCAARMRAMAAGDILRLGRLADEPLRTEDDPLFFAFTRAQRARCAAAMRARPAVLMPPPAVVVGPPRRNAAIALWILCSWD